MKKTLVASTLIGLLALGVGGAAVADPGGRFRFGRLLNSLDLNDAQEDQLISLQKDVMREGRQVRRAAVESLGAVAEEVKKPKPDAARLHAVADQRIDEAKKWVHYAIDKFLVFHASLDAKQRAELSEDLQKGARRAKKWQD
jgi:Spy/CpxP family protein refolding chaperone